MSTNDEKRASAHSPRFPDSPYVEALKLIGGQTATDIRHLTGDQLDELYTYLRDHRLEDSTLLLGYWLLSAQRDYNLTQADVAERSGISRSHISALLRERSTSRADTLSRIAQAANQNPVEIMIVLGYITRADVLSYQLPNSEDWLPIAERLNKVPRNKRRKLVALVGSILDVIEEQTKN